MQQSQRSWRTRRRNLGFQNQNWSNFNGNFVDSQRFEAESSSLNLYAAIQAQNLSLGATNPVRSQSVRSWEEEGEETEESEPVKGKKKKITSSISEFKPRIIENSIESKYSKDSKQISEQNQVIIKETHLFPFINSNEHWIDANSCGFEAFPVEDCETLTFSKKQRRFWGLQRLSAVVNQRIHKDFTRESFEPSGYETVQNRIDSTNLHGFPVFIRILASEPWLETRIKAFKPRFLCFWVDSSKLGLGFKNTRERLEKRREERERYEPNEWTGLIALLYMCLGRVDPKPDPLSSVPSRLIRILMDPDQSNAPGALVWSVPIRSVGFWA